MAQLRIENHNSVTLLNRLRIATRATTSRERKAIFNGLRDALKGLGLVEGKGQVEGIYEGIDGAGNHWFMVDTGDQPEVPLPEDSPDLVRKLLMDAIARMDRARGILTNNDPTPNNNWGILDTKGIKEKLEGAIEPLRVEFTQDDYIRLCTVALKLSAMNEGQDSYTQDLAEQITRITSRFYHEVSQDVSKRRLPGSDGEPLVHSQATEEPPKG